MTDPKHEVDELKQRRLRWRRLIAGMITGAVLLVLLCGVVNATFFAAGYAFGNVWPFAQPSGTQPNMIASYHVNQIPEPQPVVLNEQIYRQRFNAGVPHDWTAVAPGWDVQNGILYGTNTRNDVSTAVYYNHGDGWGDVTIEVDAAATTTATPSSAQLLFRRQSHEVAARCQLATKVSGQRQLQLITPEGQLLATSFHYTTGDTYRLRATAVGNKLTCAVVGFPATTLSATTNIHYGTIGLQNQNISAAFDNLIVTLEN